MLKKSGKNVLKNRSKTNSFFQRYYLLLKGHYFFSYASFAAIGPVVNLILRSRGFSNVEISYINLIIPFLTFFTNPLLGYIADRTHRFRFIFNIILILATILFLLVFYSPSIKTHNVYGEIHKNGPMEYSIIFCANENFARKCALRSQCGCSYQAICKKSRNNFNENLQLKIIHLNWTMNFKDVEKQFKNFPIQSHQKHSICEINYRVPINGTIVQYIDKQFTDQSKINRSLTLNSKTGDCEIECSQEHICDGPRYPNQIIKILLYSLFVIFGQNCFANAVTIGTSIAFASLDYPHLFGRQRLWGTIGSGLTAFIASRLYIYFKSNYVYILTYIISSILTIIVTLFIPIRIQSSKDNDINMSYQENFNNLSSNENNNNHSLNISQFIPLIKKADVIIFLLTTFVWGMSTSVIDPYLLLYIDEISPCQSYSIAGYISLITAIVEIFALFFAQKFLKIFGRNISTIFIFLAYFIRFFAYYFINQPYFILPFETMHFFTYGILFVLIAQEAFTIAPLNLAGTLQGFVYGICFGLGRGIGLLISLFIYTRIKKRFLFLIYGIFNLIGMIIYLFYWLFNKRKSLKLNNDHNISNNRAKNFETNSNEEKLLSSIENK